MKKKFLSLLLVLCFVTALLPIAALAENPLPEVNLDLGAANTENDDYEITDTGIKIRKNNQVYVLTGETDKKINMWGSNDLNNIKTFYLRLNNAALNNGITFYNSTGVKLVIEVAEGTENTIKRLYSINLTITGSGTLRSEDLGVTQSNEPKNLSALYIKDTKIEVTQPTNISSGSQWNGTCVLDGDADVTYTATADCSALVLGQTDSISHSLTMKGNSKLRCLQADAATPSSRYYVGGLDVFYDSPINLQDNAYLEAQGKEGILDSEGFSTAGYAITSAGDITVTGNASIKATAYSTAIATSGNIYLYGGKIIAEGKLATTIYAGKKIEIKNCAVNATASDGYYGIYGRDGVNVSDSWIETTGSETLDSAPDSIENSVLFNGNEGKVIGNAGIPADVTVKQGMNLNIPNGTTLIVTKGKTLTNNGTITVNGQIERHGKVICNSHTYVWQSGNGEYWKMCLVCEAETEKAAIPVITVNGADRVCKNHDYNFSFTLPDGTTNAEYGYAFSGAGGGPIIPTVENNIYSGIIKTDLYVDKNSFKLIVTAQTADGFELSVEKNITIQDKHSGGTATCKEKAKCEVCGDTYGEIDSHNHIGLKHIDAKAATYTAEGNTEYWYCPDCGKYFFDAATAKEIEKADTVIAKLTETDSGKKSPKTGDNSNLALWLAMLLPSGCAVIGTAVVRKKKYSVK